MAGYNALFDSVLLKKPEYSTFPLDHSNKVTTNFGRLTPVFIQEVTPGDTWKIQNQLFGRTMPLLAPVMAKSDVYIHYFFVPNRLVWDEWQTFITGGEDGRQEPTAPFAYAETFNNLKYRGGDDEFVASDNKLLLGSLIDNLDYPVVEDLDGEVEQDSFIVPAIYDENGEEIGYSTMPLRAFYKIWNDYYRNQNLQDEVEYPLDGGEDDLSWLPMNRVDNKYRSQFIAPMHAWRNDYFTSALPWTQRGQEVTIPIDGLLGSDVEVRSEQQGSEVVLWETFSGDPNPLADLKLPDETSGGVAVDSAVKIRFGNVNGQDNGNLTMKIPEHAHNVNIEAGTRFEFLQALSINSLRMANSIQRWLERNAVAGGRYPEQLRAHFNVVPDDGRLQRAQFLGGIKGPFQISSVESNVNLAGISADPTSPEMNAQLGSLAGRGTAVVSGNGIDHFFKEHGFLIGIMFVQPHADYFQGCRRMFTRKTKFDYPFPEFGNLGEQEVFDYEIYAQGAESRVFGYQSRYAEWKTAQNKIHGDFKDTLDYWHMARKFTNRPELNADFVQYSTDNRIFPVMESTKDYLLFDLQFFVQKTTELPYFGTPKL